MCKPFISWGQTEEICMEKRQPGFVSVSEVMPKTSCVIWTFSHQDMEMAKLSRSDTVIDYARLPGSDGEIRPDTAMVAVMSREIVPDFVRSRDSLFAEIKPSASSVTILVPWKEPPAAGTRPDGIVNSFLCDAGTFRAIAGQDCREEPSKLCFRLLRGMLNHQIKVQRIVVRQLPDPGTLPAGGRCQRASLVMAHRGNPL